MGTNSIIILTELTGAVLCGIAFSLYCLCAWPLYRRLQKPNGVHQARFSFGLIPLLFFCAIGIFTLNVGTIQLASTNNPGNFSGKPLDYETWHNPTTSSIGIARSVLELIIEVLMMAIQVGLWRH